MPWPIRSTSYNVLSEGYRIVKNMLNEANHEPIKLRKKNNDNNSITALQNHKQEKQTI